MADIDDPNRKAWTFFWVMIFGLFAIMAGVHVLHW